MRPIVIAAGGTGGHFFPAEALSSALALRGRRVVLMTDARGAAHEGGLFEDRLVISGAGIAGRGGVRAARAVVALGRGAIEARRALARLRASVVVGFGGYPAVAPALAARMLGVPVVLHEQNAVLGRANRFLAGGAAALALSFDTTARVPARARVTVTGNPVRPAVERMPYLPPGDELRVLVLGGSLGARVMSDVVPPALAGLHLPAGMRLAVTQQCRAEDLDRVRALYDAVGIDATLARFFDDVPERLAAAHLVIARAGASTVAELAVAGRPAILIPLPHAIDDHQTANAAAVGARVLAEPVTPDEVVRAIEAMLPILPEQAAAIAAHGRMAAAAMLADLVEHYAVEDVKAEGRAQ
jgi:UDP-N-acetylglucosamine--N-acetylmuramyl-(pentapeptide) pyrophosphoryl-undecaprenol N-acetylglucosamine transferase